LTLDGRDTAYAARLLLWKPGKRHDVLVVENRSYTGLRHRRAVIFVNKKFFVIVDEALGRAEGRATLHFQLAPVRAILDAKTRSARTGFRDGTNLLIQGIPQPGLRMLEEEGRVSFKYGTSEQRPAFRYELLKGTRSVRFVTALVPHTRDVPKVEIDLVGNPPPGARRVELEVRVDGARSRVGYDLSGRRRPG
jgi:heparan-sulfate lyase